jgi:hypothetical protein
MRIVIALSKGFYGCPKASFPLSPLQHWHCLPQEQATCFAFPDSAASRATTPIRQARHGGTRLTPLSRKVHGSGCIATEHVENVKLVSHPARPRSGSWAGIPRQPLSASSSFCFRSTPHRYPVSDPLAPTTRWHGTTSATRFIAQARATARVAFGSPISCATSL